MHSALVCVLNVCNCSVYFACIHHTRMIRHMHETLLFGVVYTYTYIFQCQPTSAQLGLGRDGSACLARRGELEQTIPSTESEKASPKRTRTRAAVAAAVAAWGTRTQIEWEWSVQAGAQNKRLNVCVSMGFRMRVARFGFVCQSVSLVSCAAAAGGAAAAPSLWTILKFIQNVSHIRFGRSHLCALTFVRACVGWFANW